MGSCVLLYFAILGLMQYRFDGVWLLWVGFVDLWFGVLVVGYGCELGVWWASRFLGFGGLGW